MFPRRPHWRFVTILIGPIVVVVGLLAWRGIDHVTSSTPTTTTTRGSSTSSGALSAPPTTLTQDTAFLTDVSEADAGLAAYEKTFSELALKSLLTDGSAFCAFLLRDRSIDAAMVSVAQGAQGVEKESHLPLSVTTFNTLDAVSLLTLCPAEQSLIPASDVATIDSLGASLGAH